MMMLKSRLGELAGAELALKVKRVTALIQTPAIIRAALHALHALPKILSVFAHPNCTRQLIAREPPRIAKTQRPSFRRGIGCF